MNNKTGLLDGKKEISAYLNDASNHTLKKYLEMGMPVIIKDNRWIAHKENIEKFFKLYTWQKVKNIPADLSENKE